jgi:hypothetical protein
LSQIFISCANEEGDFARPQACAVAALPGLFACSAALGRADPKIHAAFASLFLAVAVLMPFGRELS